MTVRSGTVVLVCAFLLVACGESPLAGFGGVDDWLGDRGDGTVRTVTTGAVAVMPQIESLIWYSKPAAFVANDPDVVIETVWDRSTHTDAFVQAAPNEISAALPGIKVPQVLPTGTAQVTSQLVYGVSTGRLTNVYVAAFGFWKSEPYVSSRAVSQVLQLKVAEDATDPVPAADDHTIGCSRFSDLDFTSCEPVRVDAGVVWWVASRDGAVLAWYDSGFRYEMLDRQKLGQDALIDVARSMILLRDVQITEETDS